MLSIIRKGAAESAEVQQDKAAEFAAWLETLIPSSLRSAEERCQAVRAELANANQQKQELINSYLKNAVAMRPPQLQAFDQKIDAIEARLKPLRAALRQEREAFAASLRNTLCSSQSDQLASSIAAVARDLSETRGRLLQVWKFAQRMGVSEFGFDYVRYLPNPDDMFALARRLGFKG